MTAVVVSYQPIVNDESTGGGVRTLSMAAGSETEAGASGLGSAAASQTRTFVWRPHSDTPVAINLESRLELR